MGVIPSVKVVRNFNRTQSLSTVAIFSIRRARVPREFRWLEQRLEFAERSEAKKMYA
jgi:hypothetical protein